MKDLIIDCFAGVGGAYCTADIHDWISDINDGSVCCDFDYDDTFERY